MTGALLIATVAAGLYFLASRAEITRWLWTRYPPAIGRFLHCAACSGFWYGLGLGTATRYLSLDVLGLDASGPVGPYLAATAAVGLIWTPILAFAQAYAYSALNSDEADSGVFGNEEDDAS